MISHSGALKEQTTDELGSLIQWALQERVREASPSPWVWEHIRTLAERPTAWRLMGPGFSRGCRAVMAQLFRVGAFLWAQIPPWRQSENGWVEWRFDPGFMCLLDQYSFFLLRLAF